MNSFDQLDPDSRNQNKKITDFLEELAVTEKVRGHAFKATAYTKAAQTIARYPTPLFSREEALKIPGVGTSIADKIEEIIQTGTLARSNYDATDPLFKALRLFSRISGFGPVAAKKLIDEGIMTLEQLHEREGLTKHQKIGLKHLDEFEQRIPRAEMDVWAAIYNDVLKQADEKFEIAIVGSYRRGLKDSGDVDIMLTHPDFNLGNPIQPPEPEPEPVPDPETEKPKGRRRKPKKTPTMEHILMTRALDALREAGILTDDLGVGDTKYMGVCRLPEGKGDANWPRLHRRIDIRLFPKDCFAFGQLHFTGNDVFNKHCRWRAIQRGYRLSEYAMKRLGADGNPTDERVVMYTEEEILNFLDLDHIPPEMRNVSPDMCKA
ncbi:Nucleotidyltransferase [Saitoella complicata NRRL Y-17804]|uniref:Nucleotidyltransferase n=1 Tax=Saitoella complicata (strain BCRC 22490 / CBS 7301 / JCM 7358 / NBRC 10748 / NRRL Y-17804) TaxID=698492 RepID=UPI0008681542|nr:Nucleotidyltransferase [Saitoella complicata NRRL Y-17804]ODQ52867.1 Nucleotidyltransferase [Saitoella complicata NRRL Y-17804]